MLVITDISTNEIQLGYGDTFQLTYTEEGSIQQKVLLMEKITKPQVINFCCFFRFALEDGTVQGTHISGFFGNNADLPREIREAKKFSELTVDQQSKFKRSLGVSHFETV